MEPGFALGVSYLCIYHQIFGTDMNRKADKQGMIMLLCFSVTQDASFHCRSYGRPPKTVKLKANFVRLSEGMLVDVSSRETYTTASSLHKQPFFHIYWTDCQVVTTIISH